jgi:hypothetical protein
VFSPPYLFKGPRPQITSAPASVQHGEIVHVATPQAAQIGKVTLLRLASVTHSFDEHSRINFLPFTTNATGVSVTVPASAAACPPGHYMLFLLSTAGVPSIGSIVQVQPSVGFALVSDEAEQEALIVDATAETEIVAAPERVEAVGAAGALPFVAARGVVGGRRRTYLQVFAREAQVATTAKGTAVVVGITGTCPYGIGACWGGAYEALRRLDDVDLVGPIPNADDSTADVYLRNDGLPPLGAWAEQFQRIVNGTYELRGVEVTLRGSVDARDDELFLVGAALQSRVRLVALAPGDKIQWSHPTRTRKPVESDEAVAYARLRAAYQQGMEDRVVTITGPLTQSGPGRAYDLHIRVLA